MKKIYQIILILIFCINYTNAQEQISVAIYQDAKLGIVGDKAHGYSAGTLNLVFRLKMQGNQQKYGYLIVFPEFEYAEIQGIYKRWSANVGYTFNKLIISNLEASISGGFGLMDRYSLGFFTLGSNGEIAYKLSDNFKIAINGQLVQRKDLEAFYGDSNVIRFSGFVGLEIKIF